ncbi:MAG: PQQ-binding-like beta-propeller repeat protein [Lentisphaerae bacterium]|jgi:outer membrane protein assembly factor BamB|nr:PQQ-binding-like beta-propeller repeat protein [Lentisphaerota bacterium]MBT4815971.1 PQQ-binding-like beta-propeller repeat protein [Lentisphaerota bacterium]MBT5606570.1 PQQ-binding-like beta-propeller repeat protein [Lentisphaerota bacterium]MBT7053479.1 PQQ-binding-like beta-propeller repeat protein [Lentisphaerota bacterium]MBT7846778.1 PQQ-binding-like beta-propeller repeat protein [Lentisphaerota bacterium]
MNQGTIGLRGLGFLVGLVLLGVAGQAADWPTYKGDAQRSSVSEEALSFPLAPAWTYRPSRPPSPAWPEPGKELHRIDFDYVFQPVAAGGVVVFGSSADDTVRALDLATGQPAWTFVTRGPVRFAPAIAGGNAYVVSDDGGLYCLDVKTGTLKWRFQAGPGSDVLIGNDRLISRYPCRSGALVVDNVVYVTAGLWPTEGVYVYALDAATGKELWCNDSSGSIYTDLPHAVANGFSGVAPQGYLVVSGDTLLVPTGRSVPAGFDRHTGRLLYYKPEKTHYHGASYGGGVWSTALGDIYFHTNNRFHNPSEARVGEAEPSAQDGMITYSLLSGEQISHLRGKYRVLATAETVYAAGGGSIDALPLTAVRRKSRPTVADAKWTTPHEKRVHDLALAGDVLITGNRGSIAAFSTIDGKPVWDVSLPGEQVRGLALAAGRLLAATHTGTLFCFGSSQAAPATPSTVRGIVRPASVPEQQSKRAAVVLRQSGKATGYAAVFGKSAAALGEALARQSELHVAVVLADQAQAEAARRHLVDVGLLGDRVAVFEGGGGQAVTLPPYFADLVVVSGSGADIDPEACYRVLRPCGGTLCFAGFTAAEVKAFVAGAEVPDAEVAEGGSTIVRGALPGAGEWRYAWADGGRSGIGKESRVRFPLELLWYGGPGPGRLVDRHLMGSPPISTNGRVFMQGQNDVVAFDAYNGRELWSRPIEGVGRKYAQYYSSSLVADDDSVYVVQGSQCIRLDQETGEPLNTYAIPRAVTSETAPALVPDYLQVEWPDLWQVLGPFPKGKPPLSAGDLASPPDSVLVNEAEVVATELMAIDGLLDFTLPFGGYGFEPVESGVPSTGRPRRGKKYSYHDVGRICYAFATIDCPVDGKLLIGAGADWGMQWFVDGQPVFDALRGGYTGSRRGYFERATASADDRIFDVDVTAGTHTIAVMVTAGSRGWALASASQAEHAETLMPVSRGENPNVPDLQGLVWGYLSAVDGLVLGSYNMPVAAGQAAESHLLWRSESKAVFALDRADGSLRWVYRARPDHIVSNIEIAFDDGRLFLVDGTSKADLARARRRRAKLQADLRLVALDIAKGAELWHQDDVPVLGDRSVLSRLKTNVTHLFMGLPNWGHLVAANGVVLYGANAAYEAETGTKLWTKGIRPGKLPLVRGDQIITGAGAYDLRTGEPCMAEDALTGQKVPWRYMRAYGCGPTAGCENVLFFRSGADGFVDLQKGGTTNFGGVRPGCARTLLAANGLLLHPQGYSGCCCSYNFKSNLALVPSTGQRDTWYVFPRLAAYGLVKRAAVNFGAPGDQKDAGGTTWLGFPRPIVNGIRRVPTRVSMKHAQAFYRRRSTSAIEGTDVPWVYSSGLQGQGRIVLGCSVRPNVVLSRRDETPLLDGESDDPCWADVTPIPFENTPFSMIGASVVLRMFRDAEKIYVAYRRDYDTGGTAGPGDEFDLFLAGARRRGGIRFVITPDGKGVARLGSVGVSRKVDPSWKGEWEHAVRRREDAWGCEIAIPIKTLEEAGITLKGLRMNCMSHNRTASGLEGVFLVDPLYGTKFRCCSAFVPIVPAPTTPTTERVFTVRLHFAETAHSEIGKRVFDVAIQGETVLRALDVLGAAGGRNIAIVKTFPGIHATDGITFDFEPTTPSDAPGAQPVICAVEVIEEQ